VNSIGWRAVSRVLQLRAQERERRAWTIEPRRRRVGKALDDCRISHRAVGIEIPGMARIHVPVGHVLHHRGPRTPLIGAEVVRGRRRVGVLADHRRRLGLGNACGQSHTEPNRCHSRGQPGDDRFELIHGGSLPDRRLPAGYQQTDHRILGGFLGARTQRVVVGVGEEASDRPA